MLEFKQREKRIGNLHSDVTKRDAELLNHRQTIEETKLKWLEPLKELISRINKNFAYFFNCLKCAGEVDLNIPDNPVSLSVRHISFSHFNSKTHRCISSKLCRYVHHVMGVCCIILILLGRCLIFFYEFLKY